MTLKRKLQFSTNLILVCAGFLSSYTQAEEYVTKPQINAANGVARLNSVKQVTADVNNNNILTQTLTLDGKK